MPRPIGIARAKQEYTKETKLKAAAILELRRRLHLANILDMWAPRSKPQEWALESAAEEIFYGGAAGGGKTDLLIGAALTRHRKSIIFRREYPQLREIINRTGEILAEYPASRYNDQAHVWKNLPGGRSLEFGAMQHIKDREKYQGRPHDLKGFDEITQFHPDQYKFVSGWLRSTVPGIQKRCLCTGNPPTTPDGEWVIQYWRPWLDPQYDAPAVPGELRWFISTQDGDEEVDGPNQISYKGRMVTPRSRTFIPARLSDNPFLADSGYDAVLESLPEPLRSQLLFGDFSVRMEGDPWQVIPTEWIYAAQDRWRAQPDPQTRVTRVGVDVARGGKDKTVVMQLYANWFAEPQIFPGRSAPDGPAVAREVIRAMGRDPERVDPTDSVMFTTPFNIDILGPGASVYDTMRASGYVVNDVHFGTISGRTDRSGKLRFVNIRAEMYWKLREALDPVYGDGICLPPDRELAADLAAPKWTITSHGILIEDKKEIQKRLSRSPDKGDACVLAWIDMEGRKYDQNQATSHSERQYGTRPVQTYRHAQRESGYDPREQGHFDPNSDNYGRYKR